MNSPPEPASPSQTTESSGSPPLDEISLPPANSTQAEQAFMNSPSGSKRQRNTTSYSRDAKSRRKDDFTSGSSMNGPGGRRVVQGYQEMSRQKEELVDVQLAENLRRQFGDPFDESILKQSS